MNPFMLSPAELTDLWGNFRDDLKNHSEAAQLSQVADFWAKCPYSKWTIDPEQPKEWLSVWEMFHDNEYCRNSIALAIETTLRLAGWDAKRLKLVMASSVYDGDEFFIVIIDDTHVLNYSYGEITTVDNTLEDIDTLYAYQYSGRSYKRLVV